MVKITKSNGDTAHNILELVCDTPDDMALIPPHVGWGSTCIVISTSEVYMKNSNGEWVKL